MYAALLMVASFLLIAGAATAGNADRPAKATLGKLDATRFKACSAPQTLPTARAVAQAEDLYKARDYAAAQTLFKTVQAMPGIGAGKSWALCMEAMCIANQGKHQDAIGILQKAIAADPKSVDATLIDYAIGAIYKLAYEDAKALAHFDTYIDNPDRRSDTNLFEDVMAWQVEQYRNLSTSDTNDARTAARYYTLLESWVKEHPDKSMDYNNLYKFYLNQEKWSDCLRVASYRLNPREASIEVLSDRIGKIQKLCDRRRFETAEKAAMAARPRVDALQKEMARIADLSPDARRSLDFKLMQTMISCGMAEEGDKLATELMAAAPTDFVTLSAYIKELRSSEAVRPEALDRLVTNFLTKETARDSRLELLSLYLTAAVPLYQDKSRIEKILLQFDATQSMLATLYTGWKDDKAEECLKKVYVDTNLTAQVRCKAMVALGDLNYARGDASQATNFYQMVLDYTQINAMFGAEMERCRDRIAQEQFKAGMFTNAMAMIERNIYSRDLVYRTRANLFLARENMKTKDIRKLTWGGELALRQILGQVRQVDNTYSLELKYSSDPVIRKIQDEAKAICEQYGLDLSKQPMSETDWQTRLRAQSKIDFDKKLKEK